jgi:hypothetical protein
MDTDKHGLKTSVLSVFIRVHPWLNAVFPQPANEAGACKQVAWAISYQQ